MLRGIYAAASSLVQESIRQDTIANNIANAGTAGYKRDIATFESFQSHMLTASTEPQRSIGALSFGSAARGTHVDTTRGAIHETGNSLDIALEKDTYLVVETGKGRAYTQEGSLTVGEGKYLCTAKGHPLVSTDSLGTGGKIVVSSGPARISPDGTVSTGDSKVGKLQVVRFKNPALLQKDANGYLLSPSELPETVVSPNLQAGSLEFSNVNPVKEMVSLITVIRSYEASVKSLQAQDETLSKAVNEIAK